MWSQPGKRENMRKKEKLLLLQALEGDAAAWRKLALFMESSEENNMNKRLCRIFLNKAIELGDEESFFLYHQIFAEERLQPDGKSYEEMLREYMETKDPKEKERLKRYLQLLKRGMDESCAGGMNLFFMKGGISMDKQQVRDIVMEVLRQEKRKGDLVQNASVLDIIPDAIDTIEVDKKYLYGCVKEAFRRSNPINGILGIFGLRLIREDDAQRLVHDDSSDEQFANAFKVNEKRLAKLVSSASAALAEIERKNHEKEDSYVRKINELSKKLDSEQLNLSQSRRENEMTMEAVAARLQYVFSLIGKEHMNDPAAVQLIELLTDLGMEAFWSVEDTTVSEGTMFQILKTDEPANHRMKPCMIQDNRVIAQGVMFVMDSEETMEDKREES